MEPIIRAAAVAKTTRQLRRPMAPPVLADDTQTPGAGVRQALVQAVNAAMPATSSQEADSTLHTDCERELMRQSQEFAQQSAQDLLVRQQQEAELIQVRVAAERLGYATGLAEGERAAHHLITEEVARFAAITGQLHQARLDIVNGAEDIMVDIVYSALCRLIGESVGQRSAVIGMLKQVLSQFREHEPLIVRLHPQDMALVQQVLPELGINTEQTQMRADTTLNMGGCMVESTVGTLDARLDTQLSRLREALLLARRGDEYAGDAL
jgi:flagellar assembly protein FliH